MDSLRLNRGWLVGAVSLFAALSSGWSQIYIPLRAYTQEGTSDQRIGIELAIGDSGQYYEYILDTGSDPLMVMNGVDIGNATDLYLTGEASYGASGSVKFDFHVYQADVHLRDRQGTVYTTNVQFGQAVAGSTMPGNAAGGILGAGPAAHVFENKHDPTKSETPSFNLYSILGQIAVPEGLMGGFTIRLDGANSMLTIGITESYWNTVSKVPMQPGSPPANFPNTNLPTYDSDQISTQVTFTNLMGETFTTTTEFKIDSGAPDNFFITDTSEDYQELLDGGFLQSGTGDSSLLIEGVTVSIPSLDYEFVVSSLKATQVTVYESGASGTYPHYNTGINPYNEYEITYLFDDGTGQGYVGFLPVPEASSVMLVLFGLGTLCHRRRR